MDSLALERARHPTTRTPPAHFGSFEAIRDARAASAAAGSQRHALPRPAPDSIASRHGGVVRRNGPLAR